MALRKFGPNDVVLNTMRTNPRVEYFIYDGKVYHNNSPHLSGALLGPTADGTGKNVLAVTGGAVSLYEYNVDRPTFSSVDTGWTPSYAQARKVPQGAFLFPQATDIGLHAGRWFGLGTGEGPTDTGRIYPWISKDTARSSFKTISDSRYSNEFRGGDTLTGNYPLSGTIAREIMWHPALRRTEYDLKDGVHEPGTAGLSSYQTTPIYPHFYALKNRLNYYGYMSEHYKVTSPSPTGSVAARVWDKGGQVLNLVSIPAIVYGSTIKKGTVSLKYYYTGSLLGELKDSKENGELIETIGADAGKVAGVVLYDEGFFVLTGSWEIPGSTSIWVGKSGSAIDDVYTNKSDVARWIYFGAGAYDGLNTQTGPTDGGFESASFGISFEGQTEIQVYNMFANARRDEVNYSTNPTFLEYDQTAVLNTSAQIYEETPTLRIKNTVSSSYLDYNTPFKKQVFISKIGIYDDNQNLIAIATLADPVLKQEDQDYTFKIKLDI